MGSVATLDIHAEKCFTLLFLKPVTFNRLGLNNWINLWWRLLHIPRSDGINKN